jgi:hypothetical protein
VAALTARGMIAPFVLNGAINRNAFEADPSPISRTPLLRFFCYASLGKAGDLMAKTRRGFTPQVQAGSGGAVGEQRLAAAAGRGRTWDPAFHAEAVACSPEWRGPTPTAGNIGGILAHKPGCFPV